ncbi:MAG: hypothetical protein Q8O86_03345 [Dehalococcoidia bacterium]|nr:hypothetical protein [Dehalococcoidia bacterium]
MRFKGTSGAPFSGASQGRYTGLLSREQIAASQFIASSGAVIVPVAPGREMSTVLALRADPTVEFAEVDGLVKAEADPNDPLFSTQSWNPQAIRAPAAWDAVWESQGPTVAVVDSGVDLTHPDLESRLVGGYDFVDGDDQPWDEYTFP